MIKGLVGLSLVLACGCASGGQSTMASVESDSGAVVGLQVRNERQRPLDVYVQWDGRRRTMLGRVQAGETDVFVVPARGRQLTVSAEPGVGLRAYRSTQSVRPGDRFLWMLGGTSVHSVRLPPN